MTLQQIKDAVDAKLVIVWGLIQTKQTTYAAAHNGRAWQGLRSHTVNPADGALVLPTIGTLCPIGQAGDPWPLAARNTAIEMAVQIDCYRSPLGDGYQATVWVDVAGVTYSRTQQSGPEAYRNIGWHIVEAGP